MRPSPLEDDGNGDADEPPTAGLELAEARRRLGATVDGFLMRQQQVRHPREFNRRSQCPFAASLHGGVLPPLLALILLVLGRLLSPGARTEDSEFPVFWATVGALGFCVILNAWLISAQQASLDEEVTGRLRRALRRYQHAAAEQQQQQEDDEDDNEKENGHAGDEERWGAEASRSHAEESCPVYRSGRWVRLPWLVLVEGDVIALASGDEAPASVEELCGSDDLDDAAGAVLRRGERVQFRAEKRAESVQRVALAPDSPKLLLMCGDLRCFRVVEAPLRAFLDETIGPASHEAPSPSLFVKDMAVVESMAVVVMLVLIAALIVLSSLRFTWQGREWRDGAWADYIFTEPSRLALLALPVSRPLFVLLVEAMGTARLLVVLEALERGAGREPSKDPAVRPELDVEQRLSLRSTAPLVSRRRYLQYTVAVLRARLFGALVPHGASSSVRPRGAAASSGGSKGQHVVLEMASLAPGRRHHRHKQEEEEEEQPLASSRRRGGGRGQVQVQVDSSAPLLPIPMSRSGALQRLGGVTFLSVVNDELVCRDAPIPQEVLFLNAKRDQGEAVSATVLRLTPDASSPSALRFDHAQWAKHMAQLKPIGFNCLAVPSPQEPGAQGSAAAHDVGPRPGQAAEPALVAHALEGRRGRALHGVGAEIGFSDADAAAFRELSQVHVFSPQLAQAAVDVRAQTLEERRGCGGLQPHLTAVVLEDGRQPGGMMQLLSQGTPSAVLPWCADFFDGAMLSRLTPEARSLILDTYCRRWALDDFNVSALAYTPVPASLRGQLRRSGALPGTVGASPCPIYLADRLPKQKQKQLGAIREQRSMLDSAARLAGRLRAEEAEGEPRSVSSYGIATTTSASSSQVGTPRSVRSAHHHHHPQPGLLDRLLRRRHDTQHQQQQQQQQPPHLSLLGAQLSMSMPDLKRANTVFPSFATPPATATAGPLTPMRAGVHGATEAAPSPSVMSSDDMLTSRSLRSYARASLQAHEHGALWSLLQRQVFLGLVATAVQPTPDAPPLVEELTAAGVRFTLFSPRTMRRVTRCGEALGLQMDWNCALSLRPLDSDAPDEHRLISEYGDVVRNARLPYGIPAIRQHLARVDNVPLLVSIFTDATPGAVGDMVGIFREHHESVLCVGHAGRASNGLTFRRADVAVAVVAHCTAHGSNSSSSSSPVAPDLRFGAELVGLPCAFHLGLACERGNAHARTQGLAPLMDLLQEGRRLLACLYQMVALAVMVLTTAALIFVALRAIIPFPVVPTFSLADVLWLIYVVLPLLLLPLLWTPADQAVVSRCARKDGELAPPRRARENRRRALQYLALRCVPTLASCIYVQCRGAADLLLDVPDVLAACGLPDNARWRILQCHSIPRADIGGRALAAITLAKDLTLTAFVLTAVVHSASFLHRTASLRRESPFKHPVWPWSALLLLLMQAAHLVLRAAARFNGLAALAALDWDVWTMMMLAPWAVLVIGEGVAKPLDMLAVNREARFRRLAFDTRLGTHSPK